MEGTNVDHHVMQNSQPSTKYRSMSFSAIDPKFLIMMINYASYNKQNFWNELPNLWGRQIMRG